MLTCFHSFNLTDKAAFWNRLRIFSLILFALNVVSLLQLLVSSFRFQRFLSRLLSSFRSHKSFNLFRSFFRLRYSTESSILDIVLKSILILLYKIAYTVLFFFRLRTIAKNSKSKVTYSSFTYSVSFLYSWTR